MDIEHKDLKVLIKIIVGAAVKREEIANELKQAIIDDSCMITAQHTYKIASEEKATLHALEDNCGKSPSFYPSNTISPVIEYSAPVVEHWIQNQIRVTIEKRSS